MASKLILLRQKVATALQAAISAYTETILPALDDRVDPFLDDSEPAPDFGQLQKILGEMIAVSLAGLIEADKAHIDELADDVPRRADRTSAVGALRRKLIQVRAFATGLFGAQRALEVVPIQGRTAEQPELLWRQGDDTVTRLRQPRRRLPEPSTRAVHLDPQGFADELEPLVLDLRRALDRIELDRRQATLTLEAKRQAMAEHDLLMTACSRILSGLYLLARRPDLARKMRVTLPTRGRQASSAVLPGEASLRDAVISASTPSAPVPGLSEPASNRWPESESILARTWLLQARGPPSGWTPSQRPFSPALTIGTS